MNVAIIGAGGARTPLLVRGLATSGLPLDGIRLYDPHGARLERMASLCRLLAKDLNLVLTKRSAECIEGADYVLVSIRVGGMEARARDERVLLEEGTVPQETVGPGGLAMAMRNVPAVIDYAREVDHYAPSAWIINFTNPVGIVTQAAQGESNARILGICDTPTEHFVRAAEALDLEPEACSFDYVGLNHLGWLREVFHRGEPQLERAWHDPAVLRRIYDAPLFDPERLASLRLLPTEYLVFYYSPRRVVANVVRAGRTRGEALLRLNQELFQVLEDPGADPVTVYERYLVRREAGYLRTESGSERRRETASPLDPARLTGYDRIAVAVIRAMHGDSGSVLPLDVPNRGVLPELEQDDVIEVPCVVDRHGAAPLELRPLGGSAGELLVRVKAYERLAVKAAVTRSVGDAAKALTAHPLVSSEGEAHRLLGKLGLS